MLFEHLQSSGSIALIFAGVAGFFWFIITLTIRRINKGESRSTISQEAEDMESEIDAEIAELRKNSGLAKHPPITG